MKLATKLSLAAMGLAVLGAEAASAADALRGVLADDSPSVRVAAAEALCRMGRVAEGLPVLSAALAGGKPFVQFEASTALAALGRESALPQEQVVAALEQARQSDYTERRHLIAAIGHVLQQYEGQTTVPTEAQAFYDWAYANE